MTERAPRWADHDTREALAPRFGLPHNDKMQDWEYEVADAERFDEFLAAFESGELTPMERFSLMEILIQCADDVHGSERFDTYCARLETILIRQFAWHCETVRYWAQLDREDDLEQLFAVSPMMRRILAWTASVSESGQRDRLRD